MAIFAAGTAAIYLMYRSYRLYLGKLETEKKHAEQVFESAPADD